MNQLPGKVSKKILIFGSSSFLGSNLINKLKHSNTLICIDKNIKTKIYDNNIFYFKCDVNNFNKLNKIQNIK